MGLSNAEKPKIFEKVSANATMVCFGNLLIRMTVAQIVSRSTSIKRKLVKLYLSSVPYTIFGKLHHPALGRHLFDSLIDKEHSTHSL